MVPPDHPSHLWPTEAETAADPMREGCGACACLPSGYESREPCPGPPPPLRTKPPAFSPSLADLSRLMTAFDAITYREFCAVLAETNHAADYCRGVWGPFRGAPLGYCANRSGTQGQALLALAVEKIRLAEISGRAVGCPGEGRCHDEVHHCASCGDVALVCERGDACPVHRIVTDAEVRAAVLVEFRPLAWSTERQRSRREHLVTSVMLRFSHRAGFDAFQVERAIDALLTDCAIRPATLTGWEGWLEAPLAVLKPGEHSGQCPVNVEHWNEHAEHKPDVCAWVPPEDFARRVLEVLREQHGANVIDGGRTARDVAEVLRCDPASVEKACADMGARSEGGFWFPPCNEDEDDDE